MDFKVEWENGETYEGRYDLQNTGFNDSKETLQEQVRNECEFLAGISKPGWMEDAKWERLKAGYEAEGYAQAARDLLEACEM